MMSSKVWELAVRLVAGRSHPDDSVVAVGVLVGTGPREPTTVVVEGPESVVVVEGAHEIDRRRHFVAKGLFGLVLPGVVRAAVTSGSRIWPLADRTVVEVAPRQVFSGQPGELVALSPDYGGVAYRTASGMAAVDALAHRISAALQSAIWKWYLEWDESTSTGLWCAEEFAAEGARIVSELNVELGDECIFYLDL